MERDRGKSAPWPLWVLIAGVLWGQLFLIVGTLKDPAPNNLTVLCATETAGFYTLALFLTRRAWLPLFSRRSSWSAPLLGILNAGLIEAEFWAYERGFGGHGVAASGNLLLDWLFTLPWYAGMVLLFVRGQRRSRFRVVVLLLLSGLYELGADGVVGGQLLPWISGHGPPLLPALGFLLFIAYWEFIVVYSSMILPPAWVIEAASPLIPPPRGRWQDALLPLAWLVPYAAFLILALIAIGHR
jgi:hypothetical protein